MEIVNKSDSLETFQKKMAHNRRIKAQVLAVMARAKDAGIPEKFMRINQADFESILDPSFHDASKVSTYVYKRPLDLLRKEFIVIDGGSIVERKQAGFAVLFRLIACDKRGNHKNGKELVHQLQSIRTYGNGMGRNDITESMRSADILFISECIKSDFIKNFETGSFFDEILSYRDDHVKPTIISFTESIPSGSAFENTENVMKENSQFGQYMCSLSQADEKKDKRFFRIRVKTNG